jgi:hypothetical protein
VITFLARNRSQVLQTAEVKLRNGWKISTCTQVFEKSQDVTNANCLRTADKKTDIDTLTAEFKKHHELTRAGKWRRTAEIWARHQEEQESVEDYMAHMKNS